MNIIRYLRGGLNLDDSPEIMDQDDWIDALNIVDSRTYNGKNGEKENILGTNAVNASVRQVFVNQNGTFLTWINDGSGTSWVLGDSPNITLSSGATSKNLKLILPTPSDGKISVSFDYSATAGNTQSLFCAIRNGSSVIETKELLVIAGPRISFEFDSPTVVDNIIIYTVQPTLTERIIPGYEYSGSEFGSVPSTAGQTQLTFAAGVNLGLPGASVITTNAPPIVYYDPHTATGNEYIRAMLVSTNASTSPLYLASIKAWSPTAKVVGSTIRAEVYVYTPSANPFSSHGTYEFYLEASTTDGVQFTTSLPVNRTITECTNAWKKVSLTVTIDAPLVASPVPQNLIFKLKIKNPANLSDPNTLTAGGQLYIDSFWTYNSAATSSTITLSTASVNTIGEEAVINTDYQHIGTIKALDPSSGDVVNYLFFYHSQVTPVPAKNHTIYKLDNAGNLTTVLVWSGLNFDPFHRINGGGVSGNLLYFTDGLNQPRCVHLTRYNNGSVPASEEEILHIKRGPQFPPTTAVSYVTSSTKKKIEDAQFAYQYEYVDGQFSVISPWTNIVKGEGGSQLLTNSGVVESVTLSVGDNESIPANIKRVKFVARKNNIGVPFYVGDLNIPFSSTDTIVYNEHSKGIIESIYLKQFESVPLTAGASCISKSRAWFAEYKEGYDTPTNINLSFSLGYITLIPGPEQRYGATFGPNSKFKLGVVLHDEEGRSCGVIDNGWILSTDKAILYDQVRRRLSYSISGTAPSWAKYVSFVMSKDLVKNFFVNQVYAANTGTEHYVSVALDGTETYTLSYSNNIRYLRLYYDRNKVGLGYSAKDGDFVMITNGTSGITYGPIKVMKQVGDYIYVEPVNIGSTAFVLSYQVYTPAIDNEVLYFEIERFRINEDSTIDSTSHLFYGDCEQIVTWGTSYLPQMRARPADGPWNLSIGKPYIKLDVGQTYKRNFIKYSSPFIGESNVNGLSEFNIGDEGKTAYDAGKIQKLVPTSKESTEGDVILAICASDTYSVYIDESRIGTGDGQSFLVSSPKIIGDIRKQKSGYGTINPESIIEYDGDVFWFDAISGAYVRYASNGIYPISDYKVSKYFRTKGQQYSQGGTTYGPNFVFRGNVFSAYDPYYKMIFVCFSNQNEVIGFSCEKERWLGFYSFDEIEGMVNASDHLYSINGGSIFKHDNDTEFNSFYSEIQDSSFTLSFNDNPEAMKEWKALEIEGSANFKQWSGGDQVIVGDALSAILYNRNGQQTNILANEFEVDEDCIYGEIKGDTNSGTLINGDPIYSKTLQCKLTFSGGTYKQITSAKAGFEISRGHNL
jgi:hypothetical protein